MIPNLNILLCTDTSLNSTPVNYFLTCSNNSHFQRSRVIVLFYLSKIKLNRQIETPLQVILDFLKCIAKFPISCVLKKS